MELGGSRKLTTVRLPKEKSEKINRVFSVTIFVVPYSRSAWGNSPTSRPATSVSHPRSCTLSGWEALSSRKIFNEKHPHSDFAYNHIDSSWSDGSIAITLFSLDIWTWVVLNQHLWGSKSKLNFKRRAKCCSGRDRMVFNRQFQCFLFRSWVSKVFSYMHSVEIFRTG